MSEAEQDFMERTADAISFLRRLEEDEALAARAAATDLGGRLQIASEGGYDFSEADLRSTVRLWDYHGDWHKWLSAGRILETTEDLPHLSRPYALTSQQVEEYQKDGHILLRGVAGAQEIAAYRPVIHGAVARYNYLSRSVDGEGSAARSFLQIINLRAKDTAARRFVLARRFGRLAAELLGVDAVRVYLDQALYKEQGGKTTHWHQDSLYFPLETDQVISMWMPLVDITPEMGSLQFASGSHTEGYLGYQPISEEGEQHFQQFIDERGYRLSSNGDMAAGDASFHSGWVLHGAPPNRSDRLREAMVVIFYPHDTRLKEPQNIYQERALQLLFRGPGPGDLAAGPLNPVVYDANAEKEAN